MKRLSEAIITSCLTWPFKQLTLQLTFLLHMSAYSIQLNQQMIKKKFIVYASALLNITQVLQHMFNAFNKSGFISFFFKMSFFLLKRWLKSCTICPCGKELILDWNV